MFQTTNQTLMIGGGHLWVVTNDDFNGHDICFPL